jgi:aldehyde dehydrogenase (NAD+)
VNHHQLFYIDGQWTPPVLGATLDVVDPATERAFTTIAVGSKADVDKAVAAARRAFPAFSQFPREQRLALLERLLEAYNARGEDLARAVSEEMGAPLPFAREAQVWAGRVHLEATIRALRNYEFSRLRGS